MKKLIATTILAFTAYTGTANAAIETLGGCYDKVVTACNQTAHPVPCANSGFDECDDEFSNSTSRTPKFKIKQQRTSAKLKLIKRR